MAQILNLSVALFSYTVSDSDSVHHCIYAVFSVGPNTMPCQLMVGFFAYAKSLEIHVDKQELEGKHYEEINVNSFHCILLTSLPVF